MSLLYWPIGKEQAVKYEIILIDYYFITLSLQIPYAGKSWN